jgi:hypothetical protein
MAYESPIAAAYMKMYVGKDVTAKIFITAAFDKIAIFYFKLRVKRLRQKEFKFTNVTCRGQIFVNKKCDENSVNL